MNRGLGKTVQTIAFLAWLKDRAMGGSKIRSDDAIEIDSDSGDDDFNCKNNDDCNKPHIIIVPASVLSNWEREFKKFSPDMTVIK